MIELQNDHLGKSLHGVLFNRMVAFARSLTPELPPEGIINRWLSRFYESDPLVRILVEMNEQYQITAHAIFEIQQAFGVIVISCHQYHTDKSNLANLDAVVAYYRDLKAKTGATCGTFMTEKGSKAYEKRYGFKAVRTIMLDFDAVEESEPEHG